MDVFDSIADYIKKASPGDRIILGGLGIVDGLRGPFTKHDVMCVTSVDNKNGPTLRSYRCKKRHLIARSHWSQSVGLMSSREFRQLPKLW